jgi:hypothetical protein
MSKAKGELFKRFATKEIVTALKDTPAVMINGPRQCGKTTLVRELMHDDRAYITLDDDTALAAVRGDPAGFLRGFNRVAIDEIQRAPEILRAIKKLIDDDRQPGRFLLTGSADILTLPRVSESLAGRMEIVTLFPLAQAEIYGRKPSFIEKAFAQKLAKPTSMVIGGDLVEIVLAGGYPELLQRSDAKRRQAWARDYVKAIVQRDVRDIAGIEKLEQMSRLFAIAAQQSGKLTNFAQIGGRLGLDDKTTGKYIAVLEQLYLVRRINPWFRNHLKRLIKTPRLHFLDAGLLAALQGLNAERIGKDRSLFGPLLETFVFSEILKQLSWYGESNALYHYRDKDKVEVDIVIENQIGALVGVEIKSAATVETRDFKGLQRLADVCGADFKLGVVLYDGDKIIPFGNNLYAAPVSCLWG